MSYPALTRKVEELAADWAGTAAAVSIDQERGKPASVTIWDRKGQAILTVGGPTKPDALAEARDQLKKLIANRTETMP